MKWSAPSWGIRCGCTMPTLTYIREGKRAFRYDNAPHHPEIATHPHHKHIGKQDRLMPADQPTLKQILDEAEGWLKG